MVPNIDHRGVKWQDIARRVQDHRDSTLAKVKPADPPLPDSFPTRVIDVPRKHLPAKVIEITESPIDHLLKSLAEGKLTALEVTEAFLSRTAIAQKLVCLISLLE